MEYDRTVISEDLRMQAHRLCREFLSGPWNNVSPSDIKIEPVSGGLSNVLYCCTLPSVPPSKRGPPNQVILRFYGELSTDITIESVIFMLLSERKLGPRLYGIFDGGRIEEYLPAEPLTQKEMRSPHYSMAIARNIANIHSLEVPISKRPNWILDKCKEWLYYINEHLDSILDATQDEAKRKMINQISRKFFFKELEWLNEIISQSNSPIVFSHNDLLSGNILKRVKSGKHKSLEDRLVFIDYEYCSYNYRGFDIANHFCEWCFENMAEFMGSSELFPSEQEQRTFVREYLEQSRKISGQFITSLNDLTEDSGMASPCNLSTNSSNDRSASRSNSPASTNGNNSYIKSPNTRLAKASALAPPDCGKRTPEEFADQEISNVHRNIKSRDQTRRESNSDLNDCCDNNTHPTNTMYNCSQTSNMNQSSSCITRQEEDSLLDEVEPFVQSAHLLWTLWAIKSASCSKIQFDYLKLAMTRLTAYYDAKRLYKSRRRS